MDKNRQSKRMSEILGFSLLFSMALVWLCALCLNYAELESENLYLLAALLLKLPTFGLPVLFVRLSAAKLEIPMPRLCPGARGSKSFLICVSSVGVIVLIQILYSAVFPSAIVDMGVSAATAPLGYALMLAAYGGARGIVFPRHRDARFDGSQKAVGAYAFRAFLCVDALFDRAVPDRVFLRIDPRDRISFDGFARLCDFRPSVLQCGLVCCGNRADAVRFVLSDVYADCFCRLCPDDCRGSADAENDAWNDIGRRR